MNLEVKDIQDVMKRYQQALTEWEQAGFTPLVIIPSEMIFEVVDTEAKQYPIEDWESILSMAKDIDIKVLLKRLLGDAMPEDEGEDIAGEFTISDHNDHFLSIEEFF